MVKRLSLNFDVYGFWVYCLSIVTYLALGFYILIFVDMIFIFIFGSIVRSSYLHQLILCRVGFMAVTPAYIHRLLLVVNGGSKSQA